MASIENPQQMTNNQARPRSLQEWLHKHPLLCRHIPQKEWFIFLEAVLKSLQASKAGEVLRLLNSHLPALIRHEVPFEAAAEGMAEFRSLVFYHLLNNPGLARQHKEQAIASLVSLFDSIFRLVRERYARAASLKTGDERIAHPPQLEGLETMAFYVENERFGKGYLNPAFREWTGVDWGHFRQSGWENLVHPEDYRNLQATIAKLVENGFPFYELAYRLKHHSEHWLHVVELGRITYQADGAAAAFAGVIFEASSVYHKQHLLNTEPAKVLYTIAESPSSLDPRRWQQLQEAEKNYLALFESSSLAICITRQERLVSFNRAFLSLVGAAAEAAERGAIWDYLDPGEHSEIRQRLGQLSGSPEIWQGELRMKTGKGEALPCAATLIGIQQEGEAAVLWEIADISRPRALERQLLQAQKMETLGNLAAGIAHDFNNTLGAIIPASQLTMEDPSHPETGQRARLIFHMAQRAAALNRYLLSYTELAGERKESIDLNALIQESRDLLKKMASPLIAIEYALEEDLPNITGERNQLLQALVNLALNAGEAMPQGGKIFISTRRRVVPQKADRYRAVKPGVYVEMTVRDTGPGIPKEIRNKIFKPFFTTKSAGGSSGLGLSVVYGILKKHGGYITLQSAENQGSAFKVLLPAAGKKSAPPSSQPPPRAEARSLTLLVVDDEVYLREVLVSMARHLGHRSVEAASGKEAIIAYKDDPAKFDLVILDYAMPDLNGKETYLALKRFNPALRVILCTGYGERREVADLARDPGVRFLPKPFTIETFREVIEEALRKKL
ncbi:MAG: response regulator [Calditrichaceae bacterium]|nr:ATP-binding protein [Calditrichia bacterium]NUQ42528.1 response regulator [Calditrichaceae bacterium]